MDAEACDTQLGAALQARDAAGLVAALSGSLRHKSNAFPLLRQILKQQFLVQAHETDDGLDDFVLHCIVEAIGAPDISTAICHLILDTVLDLGPAPWAAGASSQQHAAALLLQCCREQPRVAVKLAQAFALADSHLSATQQADLLDGISALLDANATSASGVSLLLHFPPLRRHFHLEAVIEDLVVSSQEPVAVRLVRELGRREMQVQYVAFCVQYGQLRSANAAVKQFGLQAEFPDVERMHRAKQLEKLVGKGLWGVAGQYVGGEPQLQRRLVESMLLAGELSLAQQHQELFGLTGEFEIQPEHLAAEQARRREQYLQMPLAQEAVHYVDCLTGLALMGQRLEALLLAQPVRHGAAHTGPAAADGQQREQQRERQQQQQLAAGGSSGGDRDAELLPAVGIDLEWQPDSENSSPPSILQISTDSEVFVVDLLALTGRDAELAAALSPVLASDRVFKLGCGIASDCKRLAGRHPRAFGLARACLDLSTLWRSHFIEQTGKRSTAGYKKRAGEISLSVLSQLVLGKPLDKSCQVSDWGRRPLSPQQLAYAALDAHAAVVIFRGMGRLHHPFRMRQGLLHHAFTYDARQGGTGGGAGGGAGSRSNGGSRGGGNGGGAAPVAGGGGTGSSNNCNGSRSSSSDGAHSGSGGGRAAGARQSAPPPPSSSCSASGGELNAALRSWPAPPLRSCSHAARRSSRGRRPGDLPPLRLAGTAATSGPPLQLLRLLPCLRLRLLRCL